MKSYTQYTNYGLQLRFSGHLFSFSSCRQPFIVAISLHAEMFACFLTCAKYHAPDKNKLKRATVNSQNYSPYLHFHWSFLSKKAPQRPVEIYWQLFGSPTVKVPISDCHIHIWATDTTYGLPEIIFFIKWDILAVRGFRLHKPEKAYDNSTKWKHFQAPLVLRIYWFPHTWSVQYFCFHILNTRFIAIILKDRDNERYRWSFSNY